MRHPLALQRPRRGVPASGRAPTDGALSVPQVLLRLRPAPVVTTGARRLVLPVTLSLTRPVRVPVPAAVGVVARRGLLDARHAPRPDLTAGRGVSSEAVRAPGTAGVAYRLVPRYALPVASRVPLGACRRGLPPPRHYLLAR